MRGFLLGSVLLVATMSSASAQVTSFTSTTAASLDQVQRRAAQLRADWAERVKQGSAPAASTEPTITAGKILTPQLDVAQGRGVPIVQITVATGSVGLADISTILTSPDGSHVIFSAISLPTYPAQPASDKIAYQVVSQAPESSLGRFAQPGAWTLTYIILTSNDGTTFSYSGQQLQTLFPSTVVNIANSGTPDTTAPTFGNGRILTRTISLGSASPYFAARLNVADNLSGVASVTLGLSVPSGIAPGFGLNAYASPLFPLEKGSTVAYVKLPSNTPTGTYSVQAISVCDVAGNCSSTSDSAIIKSEFGDADFAVTN